MTITIQYTTSTAAKTSSFDASLNNATVSGGGNSALLETALGIWDDYVSISWSQGSLSSANLAVFEGKIFEDGVYKPGRTGLTYTEGSQARRGFVIDTDLDAAKKPFTYLHEVGHAVVGLDGHTTGLSYLSVMSVVISLLPSGFVLPTTPMVLDFRELQSKGLLNDINTGATLYTFTGDAVTRTIWDAGGVDTLDASAKSYSVTLDLRGGTLSGDTNAYWSTIGSEHFAIAEDTRTGTGVVEIEKALGGSAGDSIYGGGISNPELRGNGGNDTIWGDGDKGSGMSFGHDTIYGDAGNDILYGDNGANISAGSSATVGGSDSILGGADNDKIFGEGANDVLYGEAGMDTLFGGQGSDFVSGGADNDAIYGGLGGDFLYGDIGNDTIYAYDTVNGENDTVPNYLYGGDGNDSLMGGAGADVLDGGIGNDVLNYGAGNDTITVSSTPPEQDTLNGGIGADTLQITIPFDRSSPDFYTRVIYSDDDGNFNFDLNVNSYSTVSTGTDSYGRFYIRAQAPNDHINGDWYDYLTLSSSGNDLLLTMTSSYEGSTAFANPLTIKGLGGKIEYGNDLLAWINAHPSMIDITQFTQGTFSISLGHSLTGTSSAEAIAVNDIFTNLTGGGGADSFIASSAIYSATITDFSIVQGDKIDLTAFDGTLTSYGSLNITGATNAVVTLPNGSTLTLTGVSAASLSATDFLSNSLTYGSGATTVDDNTAHSIYGSLGGDVIYCNGGNDTAIGGFGNDTIHGWTENDLLIGYYGHDSIGGDDGNDAIYGQSGLDTLWGGAGADSIWGGDHADQIGGEDGNDYLYGEKGNDTIDGGAGVDVMNGGEGDDTYTVDSSSDVVYEDSVLANGAYNSGTDIVYASVTYTLSSDNVIENLALTGSGNINGTGNTLDNYLFGNTGNNSLVGSYGDDIIFGNSGADTINGGDDNDFLSGQSGIDSLIGGAGNDTIEGGASADSLNGGDGIDYVDYSYATEGVTVYLNSNYNHAGADAAGDSLAGFEHMFGSSYGDILVGDNAANILNGAGGNDSLIGGLGADTLNGGDGIDYAHYYSSGAGVNINLHSGSGGNATASVSDAQGDYYTGIENAYGSNGYADTINGSTGNNELYGFGGNDFLQGYLGNDTVNGGAGNDTFYFGVNHGTDVIASFEGAGATVGDVISLVGLKNLAGTNITTAAIAIAAANDDGSDTVITTDGGTIRLVGIHKADLGVNDFQFS